jgi:hypothetical protein
MELESVEEHGSTTGIASQQVSIISSSATPSFEEQEPTTIINLLSTETSLQQASTMPSSINAKKRKQPHQRASSIPLQ